MSSEMMNLQAPAEADLERARRLLMACERLDQTGRVWTLEELRHLVGTPGLDVRQRVFVVPAENGELIALCGGWPAQTAAGYEIQPIVKVHPDWRTRKLEDALLKHVQQEMQRFQTVAGMPAVLRIALSAAQRNQIDLYTRHGFVPAKTSVQLERDLTRPIDESPIPTGLTIGPFDPARDLEKYHLAVRESLTEHWAEGHMSLEYVAHLMRASRVQPHLTLLAFAPGDELAGFCTSWTRDVSDGLENKQEGLIALLGVRPPYRRQGLARALFTQSMQRVRDEGAQWAFLSTDVENPNQTISFFGELGCTEKTRKTIYEKRLGEVNCDLCSGP